MVVRLKGENRIRKFRRVAEGLVSKMSSFDGVAGIIFVGGLVRGFADRFSDLDITVFLSKRDEQLRRQIYDLGLDEGRRSGVDVDLEVHFLEDFRRWRLGEAYRWELSRVKIVFDPEGQVKKVFGEKLRVPKDFWVRRIAVCAEYLKWYCCPPREDVGTVAESWIERGDLLAAHYCLNYAADVLLRLLFAINREFLPAPKWRIFYSYGLKWLPEDYKEFVEEATIVKNFSVMEFDRRLKALRKLWHKTLPKMEAEIGLARDQLTRYYVEKILHQTWIPSRH